MAFASPVAASTYRTPRFIICCCSCQTMRELRWQKPAMPPMDAWHCSRVEKRQAGMPDWPVDEIEHHG